MARTVSLSDLRTRTRELVDAEGTSGTNWVDDTELNAMINASIGQWHGMLVLAVPERFEATADITANGSASYALPADYLATLAVEFVDGDSRDELTRAGFHERNRWGRGTAAQAVAYRVVGSNIELLPKATSGTYRHIYVTQAPVLSGAQTIDGINGWEAWIYYDCAVKLLGKEESTPTATLLRTERNRIQEEIMTVARQRELAHPGRVQDVRPAHLRGPGEHGRSYGDPDFWLYR